MKIISKEEALGQGLKKFYTGEKCSHGHVSERYISGGCVECARSTAKARREENPAFHLKRVREWKRKNAEKASNYHKKWYEENKDKVLKDSARNYEIRLSDPEKTRKSRDAYLQRTFGITIDEYEERLKKQNGVCAICKQPEIRRRNKLLSVDHDHDTGFVRGLLCGACNTGIGQLHDSPKLLREAIAYLEK